MSFFTLLRLLCFSFLLNLCNCANSENYEASKRYAGKDLEPGHAYGFKEGTLTKGTDLGHVRLVVVWVKGTPGNLDVDTAWFHQIQEQGTRNGIRKYFGAKCQIITEPSPPSWRMARPGTYKFLGPVRYTDFEAGSADIQDVHATLIDDNNVYNLITNNCNTHVKNLFNKIKARDVLIMARNLLGGDYALVRRESLFNSVAARGAGLYTRSAPRIDDDMAIILRRDEVFEVPMQTRDVEYGSMRQRDVEDWVY